MKRHRLQGQVCQAGISTGYKVSTKAGAIQCAIETIDLILDALTVLKRHPRMGRPLPQGLRELIISRGQSGYLALYSYDEGADMALILAVRHQREQDYH